MIEFIQCWQNTLQQHGQRGLVILGGETNWCYQQLHILVHQHSSGDWIAVEKNLQRPLAVNKIAQAKQLLGQSYLHGICDLQQGFDVVELAILAGALRGGSLLVLIVPAWRNWAMQLDRTSMQWGETPTPKATPHFIQVIQRVLVENPVWVGWWQEGRQDYPLISAPSFALPHLQSHTDALTDEQQLIYHQMSSTSEGVWVLIAARGRGKSLLAGRVAQFLQQKREGCWVTALQRSSAMTLLSQTTPEIPFFAPDELLTKLDNRLNTGAEIPWLIVEEAATLPLPLLLQLSQRCHKILFVTTLQGYEGSGSGFLLKFLQLLPKARLFMLNKPIRWAENDPLERLLNKMLFLQDDVLERSVSHNVIKSCPVLTLTELTQYQLATSPFYLASLYQLLAHTHYRTSPIDLRRLLDAPYAFLSVMLNEALEVVAGCWSLHEGQISLDLQQAIIAGTRRPRGNLVPQTLLAHGQLNYAELKSIRVTRLAVNLSYRRHSIATQLIQHLITQATQQRQDYISACFGYTEALAKFWQQCGFKLIHIGTQKEAKSGCYSAVFIYPISEAAKLLVKQGELQLQQDWYWLTQIIVQPLPIKVLSYDTTLFARDWLYLIAFALGKRAIHSTYPNLMRLMTVSPELLAISIVKLCAHHNKREAFPSGRKAEINRLRTQVAAVLMKLDKVRFLTIKQQLFGIE